jgi:hypothetical protein
MSGDNKKSGNANTTKKKELPRVGRYLKESKDET